jgi:transcriptional regulator with GAF, ATPase, and Fis domain
LLSCAKRALRRPREEEARRLQEDIEKDTRKAVLNLLDSQEVQGKLQPLWIGRVSDSMKTQPTQMPDRKNGTNADLLSPEQMSNAIIPSLLKVLAGILLQEAESLEKLNVRKNRELSFHEQVVNFERGLIERALSLTSGNQLKAARLLGMKKSTLNGKIKIYGISIKQFVQTQSPDLSGRLVCAKTDQQISRIPNRVHYSGSAHDSEQR